MRRKLALTLVAALASVTAIGIGTHAVQASCNSSLIGQNTDTMPFGPNTVTISIWVYGGAVSGGGYCETQQTEYDVTSGSGVFGSDTASSVTTELASATTLNGTYYEDADCGPGSVSWPRAEFSFACSFTGSREYVDALSWDWSANVQSYIYSNTNKVKYAVPEFQATGVS
jgi:hypothetical protein